MKQLLLASLLMFIGTTAQAEAPYIWNGWQDTTLNLEQCLNRAEIALREAGFTEDFALTASSAFGVNAQYRATVRCAPSKEIVFFVVAGPTSGTAKHFLATIRANF